MSRLRKIAGACCLGGAFLYGQAFLGDNYLHIWDHFAVLHIAARINTMSTTNLEAKIGLNDWAMRSAPSPWLIKQRIALLKLAGQDFSYEVDRLKVIFNEEYR